jgi:hypothetical protein
MGFYYFHGSSTLMLDPTLELTGFDYVHEAISALVDHPGYSSRAHTVVAKVMRMTTQELDVLGLIGGL